MRNRDLTRLHAGGAQDEPQQRGVRRRPTNHAYLVPWEIRDFLDFECELSLGTLRRRRAASLDSFAPSDEDIAVASRRSKSACCFLVIPQFQEQRRSSSLGFKSVIPLGGRMRLGRLTNGKAHDRNGTMSWARRASTRQDRRHCLGAGQQTCLATRALPCEG